MKPEIEIQARVTLKSSLSLLTDKRAKQFKLMFGRAAGKRSVDEALLVDIINLVDEIPNNQLPWALKQTAKLIDIEILHNAKYKATLELAYCDIPPGKED